MCCYASPQLKEKFLAEMRCKRRKTWIGWKTICFNGHPATAYRYLYHPGVNHALDRSGKRWKGRYSQATPCGIHVSPLTKETRLSKRPRCFVVRIRVVCHVDDLVVMGHGQYVMRKVTILRKDCPASWLKRGKKR